MKGSVAILLLATVLMLIGPVSFLTANELYSTPDYLLLTNTTQNNLWIQIPDTFSASGYACQLDSVTPFEADLADDIKPGGAGWQIDSVIAWFTNWGSFHTWDSVPNIHFIIYPDTIGEPADSPSTEIVIYQSDYVAYMIGYPGRWRIEFGLTPPLVLDTFRYWLEVQPSNNAANNGLTGNMAQYGIGNGQDFFFRFPWTGIPTWQSSYQVFQAHLESGFMLIGTELGITENANRASTSEVVAVSPSLGRDAFVVTLVLASPKRVRISIIDEAGEKISSISDCRMINGSHRIGFSLCGLSSGVYFVLTELGDKSLVQKITKIR